jgi:hypothetical protein
MSRIQMPPALKSSVPGSTALPRATTTFESMVGKQEPGLGSGSDGIVRIGEFDGDTAAIEGESRDFSVRIERA